MSIELEIKRVELHPERATQAVDRARLNVGRRAGERVHARATERVPFNTGELAESGELVVEVEEAVIGYRARHGRFVHAHPDWNFQRGREARWLEDALGEEAPSLGGEYASAIRSEWSG